MYSGALIAGQVGMHVPVPGLWTGAEGMHWCLGCIQGQQAYSDA